MHLAAFYGHEELCRFILDQYKIHNLNVDPQDCLDFTPLLSACFRGYDQNEDEAKTSRIIIVRDLIESGADFNYQKKMTLLTPLHWASYNNDLEVVRLLISKGVQLKFSSNLESPLSVAGNC